MSSRNQLLPTKEQCRSLTDEQCRRIQEYRDPQGIRANVNWEPAHQADLIRLYMTMDSFPNIANAMKHKLSYTYKTYANRYRDWLFPADRYEREQVIVELYAMVQDSYNSGSSVSTPAGGGRGRGGRGGGGGGGGGGAEPPRLPLLSIRPSQPPSQDLPPHPQHFLPQNLHVSQPLVNAAPVDFFSSSSSSSPVLSRTSTPISPDRMSTDTTRSWQTNSGHSTSSTFYSDVFSINSLNPRASFSTLNTTNSSVSSSSNLSKNSYYRPPRQPTTASLQAWTPTHDAQTGLWNGVLRVIPCGVNHSRLPWDQHFPPCLTCGFAQCHALMIHARNIHILVWAELVDTLTSTAQIRRDLTGNNPIHFLMCSGVSMAYFDKYLPGFQQNVFGQNPLHVLDPLALGDDLPDFLRLFNSAAVSPPVLAQRDMKCRTPLNALLQHPLPRTLYRKILDDGVFPMLGHQLLCRDIYGRNALEQMSLWSQLQHNSLGVGLSEVRAFMKEWALDSSAKVYGFGDIANGARGTIYLGFFQCRICGLTNAHDSDYLSQIICAVHAGRDRNACDAKGLAPAHAVVKTARCQGDDPRRDQPETPEQTFELFRALMPPNDLSIREALHVLDPQNNSLVFNIATRGFAEILEYALQLEDPSRRRSMANSFGRVSDGTSNSRVEVSVLEAVLGKLQEVGKEREMASRGIGRNNKMTRSLLKERQARLMRCKEILEANGGVIRPDASARWRVA